jgi:hypothetical protein
MTMKEVDFRINLVASLMCVVESLGLVVTDDNQALLNYFFLTGFFAGFLSVFFATFFTILVFFFTDFPL